MKEMNLKIRRVPYSRLTKAQLADYTEKTISIVEKHEPTLTNFNNLFKALEEKKRDIELLRLNYGVDERRLRINKLKEELNLAISELKLKVRIKSKRSPELDMHVINNAINKHFRYLDKCRNDNEYSQRIAGFFDLADKDILIANTIEKLELYQQLDSIKLAYTDFIIVWNNRIQQLSERPYCNTKAIAKDIQQRLNNVFDSIEVGLLVKNTTPKDPEDTAEEFDYISLIEELNQLTGMVRKSINLRDIINHRKRNGESTDDIIDPEVTNLSDKNATFEDETEEE